MNVQSVNFQGLSFINVARPTDFEMKFLKNNYGFDPLSLEDYLHKAQIPKIENHKSYDLMVLRFPIFSENVPENSHQYGVHLPTLYVHSAKRKLTSSYVNFFISKEYVVVLHDGILSQIDRIFALCQKTLHNRTEYMGKGATFLAYKIIDALVDNCFPIINEITSTIDRVDKELENKQSQKTLEEISTTRRNLVVFHTMIKPIIPLFKELENGKHEELNGPMRLFWGNVLDHLQKIWDRVEDNGELIEGISKSNESFLSSRSNETIKVLTIFSAIILPLNLLASLFGMNLSLPFANDPFIFWKIMLLMAFSTLAMLLVFNFKKWL